MKNISKNKIVNAVLTTLDSKIEEMVSKIVERQNEELSKRNQKQLNARSIQCIRIGLIYDLVKSIENYTLVSDTLKSIDYASISDTIEISSIVERNGNFYHFNTNVITAGGWNIQCFHYRYLTKTNLPKTGNSEILDSIKLEIKKMNKIEKLEAEIKSNESTLETYKKEIIDFESKTIEQIEAEDFWADIDWNEMIRRGADQNFDYDENKFNERKRESVNKTIGNHNWAIEWRKKCIPFYEKRILKIQSKIEELV